jgi:hypothetical protein
MSTTTLVLGSIAFDDWSTPSRMPFGGKQAMAVHKLPGGRRVIHTLGPDEADIAFIGTMFGDNAIGVASALDALRVAGAQVPLIFAGRFYLVIVEDVKIDIERYPILLRYSVTCCVVQSPMAGALGIITAGISSLVGADISTAMSLVGL